MSFQVLASNLDQMAGVYEVKPKSQIPYLQDGMSIEYTAAISKNKDEFGHNIVGLNEYIRQNLPDGTSLNMAELKCAGSAHMDENQIVNVTVACPDNNSNFEQKINLSNVKDLESEKFEAPVYTSLYGVEIMMVFTKISKTKN